MTKELAISAIMAILYQNEGRLSDGFGYYAGHDVDKTLHEIAELIYRVVGYHDQY